MHACNRIGTNFPKKISSTELSTSSYIILPILLSYEVKSGRYAPKTSFAYQLEDPCHKSPKVGYSMLGKKILKLTPSSIQKFDLKDMEKLVAIVAVSEMTREYLIKQKILPEHINV